MSKKNKKILIVAGAIIAVCVIAAIIVVSVIASNHNKRVDSVADEVNEKITGLTMDLNNNAIDTPTAFTYLAELSLLDSGEGIDNSALTYFDGSKAKLDEVNANIDAVINAYQNYFKNRNEAVITSSSIDINAAGKDEVTAAINALNQLIGDLDTQNVSAKIVDSDWGIIFGDNTEEAQTYFTDLKTRASDLLTQLQARLDTINAEEAAAAAAAAQAAANSSSSKSSSSEGSGSSSSSSQSNDEWQKYWGTPGLTDYMASHGGHEI